MFARFQALVWTLPFTILSMAVAQSSVARFVAPTLTSPEPQNVGTNASWNITGIAPGDIDGDGKPDLVIGVEDQFHNPQGYLEWLKGNGDGTFVVKQFPMVVTDLQCQLADVNGDGRLDLITSGTEIDVYLGNGNGTFQAPLRYMQSNTSFIANFVVANLNNDARPDLAVLAGGNIQILLNQGAGVFTPGANFNVFPANTSGSLLGAADFNADGHNDLLISNGASISVLIGSGTGTFTPGNAFALPAHLSFSQHSAQILDVNHDGRLDVVASLWDRAEVLLGNGNGTFHATDTLQNPLRYVAGVNDGITRSYNVMAGDFNHDKNPDFAVGPSVYLGQGDGTFKISKFYAVTGSSETAFDLNNDGNIDLIWVNGTDCCGGYINVALGSATGLFSAPFETVAADPTLNFNVSRDPQSIVAGDFNRDGIDDIAVRCQIEKLCIFPGTGRGFFGPLTLYPISVSGVLAVGDLNGDGFLDLVGTNFPTAGAGNYDTTVLLGNGNGTFKAPHNYLVLKNTNVGNAAFLLDINNDHKLDLVGSFGVALGNGDGTFQTAKPLPASVGNVWDMAWGDFNRDGFIDLAVSTRFQVHILLGNGSGSFPTDVSFTPPRVIDGLAVADVNKDGIPDLLYTTVTNTDAVLAVALGQGNGSFAAPVIYPYSAHYCCFDGDKVLVADLDGDGISDVLVTTYGHVEFFQGLAGGTFGAPREYANSQNGDPVPPYDTSQYAFLDINGDGYLDLAVTDQVEGISRLLNTGLPPK